MFLHRKIQINQDTIILEYKEPFNYQLHSQHQDNSLQEDIGNSQQKEDLQHF